MSVNSQLNEIPPHAHRSHTTPELGEAVVQRDNRQSLQLLHPSLAMPGVPPQVHFIPGTTYSQPDSVRESTGHNHQYNSLPRTSTWPSASTENVTGSLYER